MTFTTTLSADVFPMLEHLYPRRPQWTSGGLGRGQQHSTQVQTSRNCTHILGVAGLAAEEVLAAGGRMFLSSGRTHPEMHHQGSEFPAPAAAEMSPRQGVSSQLPLAAKDPLAAEQPAGREEQQATGQDAAAGAGETKSCTSRCRKEKRGRLYRGHSRWAVITHKGRGRASNNVEAKRSSDATERTHSSSPSLSWEDVEYAEAGISRVPTLFTERQDPAQRTSSHQRHLPCGNGCDSAWSSSPDDIAVSASSCEETRLSRPPVAGPARAPQTADCSRHFRTVVSGVEHYLDAKKKPNSGAAALPAPSFYNSARCASFVGQACSDGAEEGWAAVACAFDTPRPLGEREKRRQRAVSCPCDTGHALGDGRRSSRLCRSSSLCVASFAANSGEAHNTRSLSRMCASSVSLNAAGSYDLSAKAHAGEAPLLLRCDSISEKDVSLNSARQANDETAEMSDSGIRSHTAQASELSPSMVCPFYARGLCPAGAVAAAAVRPAVQLENVLAEIPPSTGTSAVGSRYAAITSLMRASATTAECVATNSADSTTRLVEQVAVEYHDCDACPHCMDTCDHISCLRCLPRRSHPDALPPFLLSKEIKKLASPEPYTCARTHASAVDAEQLSSLGGGKSASVLESRDIVLSTPGFPCETSPSAKPGELPCSRLVRQNADAGVASRSVVVEQSHSSCPPSSKSWVRTASVPASGLTPDIPKRKDAANSSHPGGSWAPCSWFPYRCLRLLAPPARPPVSYSQCQVDRHCRNGGCWLLANGLIYDALPILYAHPGGPECLLRKRGQDCSRDFAFHSRRGQQLWSNFVVGEIKPCRGWTERKAQQKDHQEEGAPCQRETERFLEPHTAAVRTGDSRCAYRAAAACKTAHIFPSISAQSTSEVIAAENGPKQRELLHNTLTRAQDHTKQESASGRSNGRAPSGSPDAAESTTFCRIM